MDSGNVEGVFSAGRLGWQTGLETSQTEVATENLKVFFQGKGFEALSKHVLSSKRHGHLSEKPIHQTFCNIIFDVGEGGQLQLSFHQQQSSPWPNQKHLRPVRRDESRRCPR